MTDDALKAVAAAIRADLDRLVRESLDDPDIRDMSPDFKRGYEKGLREGMSFAISDRIRRPR